MGSYEQIRKRMKEKRQNRVSRMATPGAKLRSDQIPHIKGIHLDTQAACPDCGHKFHVRIVVNQVGLMLLTPNYDRKTDEPIFS